MLMLSSSFFFQAEDGIRDPLWSRGLGDVYKRQPINQGHVFFFVFHLELTPFSDGQLSNVSARPTVFNWEKY